MSLKESARSRRNATAEGLSTYKGEPCNEGHDGMRYVANRACIGCSKQASRLAYDTSTAAARKRAYRARLKAQRDLGADLLDTI